MKYISVKAIPRLLTAILAHLDKADELDELSAQVKQGSLAKVIHLLELSLESNKEILQHIDDDISDINKLHAAYKFLHELNEKREKEIAEQKELLKKLEELLWLNLEDFNRLRAQYTIGQIRDIFDKNLGDPKLCEECNKMFVAASPRQKFCSVDCRRKSAEKRK